MADHTHIEWTDATWNPVTGCSIVSPGCTNCYAMKLAGTRLKHHPSRAGLTVDSKAGAVWNGQVRFNEGWLEQPLKWKRPRMIFVCAHGDLFAEGVPDEWIDRVFAVMALSTQHTFQVLTKRAARMREYVRSLPNRDDLVGAAAAHIWGGKDPDGIYDEAMRAVRMPLPNVWLGVSVERQQEADERVPELLATPAAIRFVSAEPLLGPIDMQAYMFIYTHDDEAMLRADHDSPLPWRHPDETPPETIATPRLDQIIVGGESGPKARPMHPDWARQVRDQCAAAGVPFFFKQWGNWAWSPDDLNFEDGKTWAETIMDASRFIHHSSGHTSAFVAKKRAGRLLDGVEHNGMPQAREVPAL